jgi:hypothetical protein
VKYACIEAHRDAYGVTLMCQLLGVSRSGNPRRAVADVRSHMGTAGWLNLMHSVAANQQSKCATLESPETVRRVARH